MQRLNLKNSYVSGKFAEFIAKIFFVLNGYSVVASRFSVCRGSGAGEIDLIIKRSNYLVFVEVKKRSSIPLAMEAIFQNQKYRIYKSAEVFLARNPKYNKFDCRFDAICFNKFYFFKYIKNAWGML